jgi:hypothetical protein
LGVELKGNHLFAEALKKLSVLSKDDIKNYCTQLEPELSATAMNWRIHNLLRSGEMKSLGRGLYTFRKAGYYRPVVSGSLQKLYKTVAAQFPYAKLCIWETRMLNQFMQHQPGINHTIVEVEKEALEAVFFFLKEQGRTVFLKPGREVMDYYVSGAAKPVIVLPLITEAPLEEYRQITTASLEKMLVDIFCNDTLFIAQQGKEMSTIYSSAFSKYLIRQTQLLRYAARKGKREEINNYLKKNTDFNA